MTPPTILVAEDNPGLARVLSFKLRTTGMLPTVCRDGVEAWAAFQSRRPMAVVSDLLMPGMTGLELVERIREVATPEEVPFVLVTGRQLQVNVEELRARYGIAAVLSKPISPTDLCQLLRDLIATPV